jgi:hypothetical protein
VTDRVPVDEACWSPSMLALYQAEHSAGMPRPAPEPVGMSD